MHTRFSNKIPKYSRISVPRLAGQKGPAEQRFVGGVFALSVCYIGNAAGLLRCLRVSALFVLLFFRLRIRPPALSPTLSPARPRAWSPISTSGGHRLVRLVWIYRCNPALLHVRVRPACISRCKPSRLHARARPACISRSGLPLPVIHAPSLGSEISGSEASAASTRHPGASALEASDASALYCGTSALEASTASTLHYWASALEAPDVSIRALGVRAIWARSPGIVRPCRLEIYAHSRSAGHSAPPSASAGHSSPPSGSAGHPASPSGSAAATLTASPSLSADATTASAPSGKRFTGQYRQCQCNNDRCFD